LLTFYFYCYYYIKRSNMLAFAHTGITLSAAVLVAPGDSDGSYLLHKLRGTQGEVGGGGLRMPYGALPLQQGQINLVQQWIEQGAPDN
jgi:hypothetical protein